MPMGLRGFLTTLLTLGLAALPAASQQTGTILVRATDGATASPLPDVQVSVTGGGQTLGGITSTAGRVLLALPPGTYTVTLQLIGYEDATVEGVVVRAGEVTEVSQRMDEMALTIGGIIVTGSKAPEKAVEAPATNYTISERTVEERPVASLTEHLAGAPGVDMIQQSVSSANVVVRGFNNIFSGALHALTDYRIAGVPSLRVNLLHFIPSNDDDIGRIEVVLGPGSALYGPNTANGVLHMITKSPLALGPDEPRTTVALAGGERSFFKGMFRTSHLISETLGVKVSGQFVRGEDWHYTDPTEEAARQRARNMPGVVTAELQALAPDASPSQIQSYLDRIGVRDFDFQRYAAEIRADWQPTEGATWIFQAGATSADGVELTGIGAGQTEGWLYSYLQTRFNWNRFFAQAYLNASDAGDSFLVRQGVPLVDKSTLLVGQLQHGFGLGDLRDDGSRAMEVTYGADLFLTTPKTEGRVTGKYEDDDEIQEVGAYVQTQTALTDRFDLVTALRVDKSSILDDPVFSPRAAVVFEAAPNQFLRATYNRAFSTPTTLNYFLDVNGGLAGFPNNPGFFLRAQGPGRDGLSFTNESGGLAGVRSPFTPSQLGGPGQLLPPDAEALWPLLIGALAQGGLLTPQQAQMLNQLPVQGVGLNLLDPVTQQVTPAAQTSLPSAPPLKESISSTFELGYQGTIDNRVRLAADIWYQQRENFTSPLLPQTPLVLIDGAAIAQRLIMGGMDPAQAAALAETLGSVPVGVVSSEDVVTQTADIVATYVNFGEVDLWGADLALKAFVTDEWTVEAQLSWVGEDYFVIQGDEEVDVDEVDNVNEVLSLNAPDWKGSLTLGYRDAGFTAEGRLRFTSEFPVNSADFIGLGCIPGLETGAVIRDCVGSRSIVDALFGYRLPDIGTEIQLSVTNLFDADNRSFVGVPSIGRLAMLQVKYEF